MPCDEGRKNWLYRLNCKGEGVICPHCDQRVCEYHRHTNDGSIGGHSGCNGPQCDEGRKNWKYRRNCKGEGVVCPHCDQCVCEYHRHTNDGSIGGHSGCNGPQCDEGRKNWKYRLNCKGEGVVCPHCDQWVCEYHRHTNDGSIGGHSGCNGPQCDEGRKNWLYRRNCKGEGVVCPHCEQWVCEYHRQQTCSGLIPLSGGTKVQGGHTCTEFCETSAHYRHNCSGPIAKCTDCGYKFCAYHMSQVGNAFTDLVGGHVCEGHTAGGAAANVAGQAAHVVAGAVAAATFTAATGGVGVAVAAAGGALSGAGAKRFLEGTAECSTTTVFHHMCSGACAPCPHCSDSYCRYHMEAVDQASVPKGGHVCREVTAGASAANAAAFAVEAALIVKQGVDLKGSASSAAEFVRTARGGS